MIYYHQGSCRYLFVWIYQDVYFKKEHQETGRISVPLAAVWHVITLALLAGTATRSHSHLMMMDPTLETLVNMTVGTPMFFTKWPTK